LRWQYSKDSAAEKYLEPIHFQNLGKLLFTMSLLWGYFVFNERLTTWYGNGGEMPVFHATQSGRYAPLFWLMVFAICHAVPIPRNSTDATITGRNRVMRRRCRCGSERFHHCAIALYKSTPYSWGSYTPRPEIVIFGSSFAAMALLYLLFTVRPIISRGASRW
jgi:hypothetical protein